MLKKRIKKFIFGSLLLYLLLLIMMYFFQEKIIFKKTVLPQNYKFQSSYPFQEVFLDGEKNGKIHSLWFKSKSSKGVIVYYHGNRAGLERWSKIVEYFTAKNYDVFVMDYRGYGKSTGILSEEILYNDAELVYNYVKMHYSEKDISIYGRSLGSGIATYIASKNNPKQVILETPYYSFVDVVNSWAPIFPKCLFKYKMKSGYFIKKINCPVTIFHGTEDKVVPLSSAIKLYESAVEPKEIIVIPTANHGNVGKFEIYHSKIKELLP